MSWLGPTTKRFTLADMMMTATHIAFQTMCRARYERIGEAANVKLEVVTIYTDSPGLSLAWHAQLPPDHPLPHGLLAPNKCLRDFLVTEYAPGGVPPPLAGWVHP
jgi:hypothetical protein